MKIYISSMLALVTLSLACTSLNADLLSGGYQGVWNRLTGKQKIYNWQAQQSDTSTKIGFSLYNKSDKPAIVMVENTSIQREKQTEEPSFWQKLTQTVKNLVATYTERVPAGAVLETALDTTKTTRLSIFNCTSISECDPNKATLAGQYEFTPNKTIYVSWKDGKLYPQTGALMGLAGVNDAGYSLKNNVTQADIKKIK